MTPTRILVADPLRIFRAGVHNLLARENGFEVIEAGTLDGLLAAVDAEFEDAARTLGKSEWQVFRRVTLPLASRGIVAALMLAFARALGDFGATLMVAGNIPGRTQTAAIAIYDATQAGRDDYALALVLILSATALAIVYATNKLVTSDK